MAQGQTCNYCIIFYGGFQKACDGGPFDHMREVCKNVLPSFEVVNRKFTGWFFSK
jgi:hypothetical protein